MGKQRAFAQEEQPYAARELDLSLPDGVDLKPTFNPLSQTKEYNPVTQKKDIVRDFDPYSMLNKGVLNTQKLPFDILRNRVAADELKGKAAMGASEQLQKDHDYLESLKNKSYTKLNEMNSIQSLAPYLAPNKPTTEPSAYHQRYEWTLQELRKRGVKDQATYLQAKKQLEQEGGEAWYNLQQLIKPQLKDDKGKPVALGEDDLYGRLAQESVLDAIAKPHALQMLLDKGWKPYNKPKEQDKPKEQTPAIQESHEFLKKNNNILQSFNEWKQKNNINPDVTPYPMRKADSKTAVISKEAVEKEKAWLEGAFIEHQLNKHLKERSDDPWGRREIFQKQLQALPRGKDDRTFLAKLGDFGRATIEGYDPISDRMAAVGEFFGDFLSRPVDTFFRQDKEAEQIKQLIDKKQEILNALDMTEREKLGEKFGTSALLGLEPERLPIRPSVDNKDHYVIDKEALNKRDLAETTLDSFGDLLGYSFNKKFTAVGAALGSLPGAAAGAVADAVLETKNPRLKGINETAFREALADDVMGLRASKEEDNFPLLGKVSYEQLLGQGIKGTGELLVDLVATGNAAKGVQQGVATTASKLTSVLSKAKSSAPQGNKMAEAFGRAIQVGEKASEYLGKPLTAIAEANPKAVEAFGKVAPVFETVFKGTPQAALDGAIHFGIAEMLSKDPYTTPETIANAVADGAVFAVAETAVHNILTKGATAASQFIAKKKLDNYGKSTIDRGIYEAIENTAKLKEIEQGGIETLSNQLRSIQALKSSSQVIAGGVAEPVQTLAENARKEGNPLAGYTNTAFLGDVVGGMLFGALGVPRMRTPKLDASGDVAIDPRSGNPVLQTLPFTSVADVKKAMDAQAVQEYARQTSEDIQKGVKARLQKTEQALQDNSTETSTDTEEDTKPIQQEDTTKEYPTLERNDTVTHLLNQFEGLEGADIQFSSQKTEANDIVQTIRENKSAQEQIADPYSLSSNVVDKKITASQKLPEEKVNSVIQNAVSIISSKLKERQEQGEQVGDTDIKQYADKTADTIAFLQSKGADVAVLPSVNIDGDVKYGLYAERKDRDGEVVASLIALNLPDTLLSQDRVSGNGRIPKTAFHEFNHRFRSAIDAGAISDNSAVGLDTLVPLKEQETQALNNLIQNSPYVQRLFDKHKAAGLDDKQALEELSSLMFENIYAKGGDATSLLRHIAALDKLQQPQEPTGNEIDTPSPAALQKLVGRLPNVFKNAIEPLQNYFQGAKQATAIQPDIVAEASVFQEYYDAAFDTVVQRNTGEPQAKLTQDINEQFGVQVPREFTPQPITPEHVEEHTNLIQFASRTLSDLKEDDNYVLNLKNMADMQAIPQFLEKYYGFNSVKQIYDAFNSPTGVFATPSAFVDSFVAKRMEQMEKSGNEITPEDKEAAERFATKVWVKFQGYEPTQQANVVIRATDQGLSVDVDHNPKRIGGANQKSTINKPAGGYRLKRVNYENFLHKISYIDKAMEDNGLSSRFLSNPLVQALQKAAVYDIASMTLETQANFALENGQLKPAEQKPTDIDTAIGRYNQIEEAKWDPEIYKAMPTIATDLLAQGWFVWNHADKGGVTLLDLREYMNNPESVKRGLEGVNKAFINYYISNADKPYTWTKTKRFIDGNELNLLNYVNYIGNPNNNNVRVVIDETALQGLSETAVKKINEELNKTPEPITDDMGNVIQASKQSFMQELEHYINENVLQGYAFMPTKEVFKSRPEFAQQYLIGKTQSVIDSLMHIHIDPAFDRIKVLDKYDAKTGTIKMMKANEKYMRGVVGANSVPISRDKFLMLPQVQKYIKDGKLDVYGLEDTGDQIVARGFVLNTKKADKILAAFPTLAKVFNDTVIDGGVLSVNDMTQDLLTLLGGQEGKSNKTHSHQRLGNGALNFKQAVHRYQFGQAESALANEQLLDANGQLMPNVYAELQQFMNLMRASNIQWIIPDSALKAKAQYIPTKNIPTTQMYGKQVVMGSKGNIVGEYAQGEIRPMEEFQQTDGYNVIMPDKEDFSSPNHPFVIALQQGHGLVKIPLTGPEGLQWMDSISPQTKAPQSGGLPAQLLYKGHPMISPFGINGLNPNEGLAKRLEEAGYGDDNAFSIITDRIKRHAAQKRDRLWKGYNDILSALGGKDVFNDEDIVFTIEELQKSLKSKVEDIANPDIEQDLFDYNILQNALIPDAELGKNRVNIPALGPLLLLSDTLFENESGKLTYPTAFSRSGENTRFFSLLSKTHEEVASIKGRGALLTLTPDFARAKVDTARAKHLLTQTLNGTPVKINGKALKVDVADYLKNDDGSIDLVKLDKVLNKEIDGQTGMFKDGGQGITIGYDTFQKIGAKLGDKVILTIIPMTDISDMVPMVITGISNHKGTMTYNKELMLKVQGRDHDIDKASIMLGDETWVNPNGVDTFDLFHELLTHNKAHKALGKKMLIDAKEMIDKPDKASQEQWKRMYVPKEVSSPNGLLHSYRTFVHPLNNESRTEPARKYIAEQLWNRYAKQAQKGLLPFDGFNPEKGIEEIYQAITNIYKPSEMPVLSPLHYLYGNQARGFYSNGEIDMAALASNNAMYDRQVKAANGESQPLDLLLKQYFQLSFGKEGAVDIFSNHPYQIDNQDFVAQLFDKSYTGDAKEKAKFYKEIKSGRINKNIKRNQSKKEGIEDTFSRLSASSNNANTSEYASLQGLQTFEGNNGSLYKNTLQSLTGKALAAKVQQLLSPEQKALQNQILNSTNQAINYALGLWRAMDTGTKEADYGKVFEFVNANLANTSSVHLPIVQRMASSDNIGNALIYGTNSAKRALYTSANPLQINIRNPLPKKFGNVQVEQSGYKVSMYAQENPDTGFPEKPVVKFQFPQQLTDVYAGYTQENIGAKFPDVKVGSNALEIPLDKLFGVVIGDTKHDIHPVLTNKVGWLRLMGEEFIAQSGNKATQVQATNAFLESMLVQNIAGKYLPVMSSLNFSNNEKESIFVDILDHIIRKNSLESGTNVDEVAGMLLTNPLPTGEIVKYLKMSEKANIEAALHNIHSQIGENIDPQTASKTGQNDDLLRFVGTLKTANNAVIKFENFANSIKQTPFGLSKAGTLLLLKYTANGINPSLNNIPVMDIFSQATEEQLCKVFDKEYEEQLSRVRQQQSGEEGLDIAYSSLGLEMEALSDYSSLLPPSYTTQVLSTEQLKNDWSRLLRPLQTTIEGISSWKMGMGTNILLSPETKFNNALKEYASANNINPLDIGKPEVLTSFLHSELKSSIGEDNYNRLQANRFSPSTIMAANVIAKITALQPELVKRNEFVTSEFFKEIESKQALQLKTLKDVYGLWSDIKQSSRLQAQKDNVEGLSGRDGSLGITNSFKAAMRRMNPGVRGTSRSIVERYTSWYTPQNTQDSFYTLSVPDGQGGVNKVPFKNYQLTNSIAAPDLGQSFTMVSPSLQYVEAADIERTKSYEMERAIEHRIRDFEEAFKDIRAENRFDAGKTLKMLANSIYDAGIVVNAETKDGVPYIYISTGIIDDPAHPLGQNLVVAGDNVGNEETGIEQAARGVRNALSAMAQIGNEQASMLMQQPYLFEATKGFIAKLLWQSEQENNLKAMNEQIKDLQGKLIAHGLSGVARDIDTKRRYFDKILMLTQLKESAGIDEQGENIPNEHYKWALAYFPQQHESKAAMMYALRGNMIQRQQEEIARNGGNPELDVDYETIEKELALLNADAIANNLQQEVGFRKVINGLFEQISTTPDSQLLATASIASHGLPRIVQEQLYQQTVDLITPVNGDVLLDYAKGLSKSYLSSVSVALEHLYKADMQQARQDLLTKGIEEEPENAFVAEEVLSSITEMRGDQYIWDRIHDKEGIVSLPKGTPLQLHYTINQKQGKVPLFTTGYLIGTTPERTIIFDRNSYKIKMISTPNIVQATQGRAIPSPFGVLKSSHEDIQNAIESSIGSEYVQAQAAKAIQNYLEARSLAETDPNKAQELITEAQTIEKAIGNRISEDTSLPALKEAGAKALVASSVFSGYLGFNKIAHSAILGLAGGIAGLTGHSSVQTSLFGLAGMYGAEYFLNVLGAKSANNLISAFRESLNTLGVRGALKEAFKVDDTKDKSKLKELQSLPQFTADEIGLAKEYSRQKAKLNKESVETLRFLESFSADPNNTAQHIKQLKKLQAQGKLSLQDVQTAAEAIVPYIEQNYKRRFSSPDYGDRMAKAIADYGYEPLLNQWFDNTGMTLQEAEELRNSYKMQMLKNVTLANIIPLSETLSKRIADKVHLSVLNGLGLTSSLTDVGKTRAVNKLSHLAVGEYGNRNLLERTQLGRFMSLYSRFKRTVNAYYWNDVMKNANVDAFVQSVGKNFPSLQFEYGSNVLGLEGRTGVKSNVRVQEGNAMMGTQDEIVNAEALQEFPYLHAFQKKLRWSAALGAGMIMFRFGLPLLLAGAEDDDNTISSFIRNSPEFASVFEDLLKQVNQRTGIGDSYTAVIAMLTNLAVETLSNIMEEDALQTKLETKSWTKKEAQSYVNTVFQHPSAIAMSMGMGKGFGSASQFLLDVVYGNAMAVAYAKGVVGNGYTDSPDQQQVIMKTINKREAQMANELLGSIYGVETINSLVLQPSVEIAGAYQREDAPTKRERESKKKASDVLSENNPFPLLYEEK